MQESCAPQAQERPARATAADAPGEMNKNYICINNIRRFPSAAAARPRTAARHASAGDASLLRTKVVRRTPRFCTQSAGRLAGPMRQSCSNVLLRQLLEADGLVPRAWPLGTEEAEHTQPMLVVTTTMSVSNTILLEAYSAGSGAPHRRARRGRVRQIRKTHRYSRRRRRERVRDLLGCIPCQ